jgi:predicted nucleotidyltransferase
MIDTAAFENIPPRSDINAVLDHLAQRLKAIFGPRLVGFYLTGSLSYGDFDPGRSDIDLLVVLKSTATAGETAAIEKLHKETENDFPKWKGRIECSYIPLTILKELLPPAAPRPYFGNGIFYPEAEYGHEWIINQFHLYHDGIALLGPEFRTLLSAPVDINDVRTACRRDLYKEWVPKLTAPQELDDPHLQSYIVLNLCRILCTVRTGRALSKKAAAAWACEEYPRWAPLIHTAEDWHYGLVFLHTEETLDFIRFARDEVGPLAE